MFDVTLFHISLNLQTTGIGLRVGRAVVIAVALVLLAPTALDAPGWFTIGASEIGGRDVLAPLARSAPAE